jgi:hypothetical protein
MTEPDQIAIYTPAGDVVDDIRVPAATTGGWYTIGKS